MRAALLVAMSFATVAHADDVPFAERAPAIEGDVLRVVSLGTPDERIQLFAPARLSARRRGEARARAQIVAWLDRALGRVRARPAQVDALMAVVPREAHVVAVRPLVDGSAFVVVEIPVAALRAASDLRGVPWAP